jgi:hypothetical protein
MLSSVRWFVDPGHGWLRVPLVSCEGLRFSEYSYIDRAGGWLYLEEDCDAGVWLRAHDLRGSSFGVVDFEGDCFVRLLPRLVGAVADG